MDYIKIGQRIRKARKAKGYSQEQLAETVDISVPHMSHIETGSTKLSLPVLVDIAAALEVSTDALLFDLPVTAMNQLSGEMAAILARCDTAQAKIITDIARAAKQAMDQHH